MKKARPSKNRRTEEKKRQNSRFNLEAMKIGGIIEDCETAHSYETTRKPADGIARNPSDLLGRVEVVASDDVLFFLRRRAL